MIRNSEIEVRGSQVQSNNCTLECWLCCRNCGEWARERRNSAGCCHYRSQVDATALCFLLSCSPPSWKIISQLDYNVRDEHRVVTDLLSSPLSSSLLLFSCRFISLSYRYRIFFFSQNFSIGKFKCRIWRVTSDWKSIFFFFLFIISNVYLVKIGEIKSVEWWWPSRWPLTVRERKRLIFNPDSSFQVASPARRRKRKTVQINSWIEFLNWITPPKKKRNTTTTNQWNKKIRTKTS